MGRQRGIHSMASSSHVDEDQVRPDLLNSCFSGVTVRAAAGNGQLGLPSKILPVCGPGIPLLGFPGLQNGHGRNMVSSAIAPSA